jgi:hypothetical protein
MIYVGERGYQLCTRKRVCFELMSSSLDHSFITSSCFATCPQVTRGRTLNFGATHLGFMLLRYPSTLRTKTAFLENARLL